MFFWELDRQEREGVAVNQREHSAEGLGGDLVGEVEFAEEYLDFGDQVVVDDVDGEVVKEVEEQGESYLVNLSLYPLPELLNLLFLRRAVLELPQGQHHDFGDEYPQTFQDVLHEHAVGHFSVEGRELKPRTAECLL